MSTNGVGFPQFNMSRIVRRDCVKIRAISRRELWNTQLFAAVPIHKMKLMHTVTSIEVFQIG